MFCRRYGRNIYGACHDNRVYVICQNHTGGRNGNRYKRLAAEVEGDIDEMGDVAELLVLSSGGQTNNTDYDSFWAAKSLTPTAMRLI